MKAVIQRVSRARVVVEGHENGAIERGLLVLLGVGRADAREDADYLVDKIVNLRIFEDDAGKMNRSLIDVGGGLLVISQFTLYGNTRKGRRPSFIEAAPPEEADALYRYFLERARAMAIPVGEGVFGAEMAVELVNQGPVTILLDSADRHAPRRG